MKDVMIIEHTTGDEPYYEVQDEQTGKRIGDFIYGVAGMGHAKRIVEKKGQYKVIGYGFS